MKIFFIRKWMFDYLWEMRNVLFIFLLLGFVNHAKGQFFNRIDSLRVIESGVQLQNPWSGGINFPAVNEVDVNGDGRNDIFIYDKFNSRKTVFLNNGNTNYNLAWDYAPQYADKFPEINQWVMMYDYNCDGKEDLFTLSPIALSAMAVYRNDYSIATGLQFTLVDDYLDEKYQTLRQNIFVSGVSVPGLSDIDGDGDMDIIGYNSFPDARFIFHKNYSMERYGNCDSLDFEYATGCWGNFALMVGGANEVGCFHCPCREGRPQLNTPEFEKPVYEQSEAAPQDDTVSAILLIDIDGDNDKDMLIGDVASSNSLLVVNEGTSFSADMGSQDTIFPSYDVPALFDGFHYHYFIDLDNNGVRDLLVVPNFNENHQGMWYYRNDGTNSNPIFEFTTKTFLQQSMIEAGENAAPVLYDYNNDGLLDLMIGFDEFISSTVYKTGIRYYKNTGTSALPSFELIDSDIATISQYNFPSPVYPAFGDLDGDGDKDLILGNEDGRLAYFVNNGGAGNVSDFSFVAFFYMGIDVGKYSTPQIYDLNNDGLNDLIIGEQNGYVNLYKNIGSSSAAFFDATPTNDSVGCVSIQGPFTVDGFTVPFFYDSLGSKRLLVANENGFIYSYDNIDADIDGCYNFKGYAIDSSESTRIKFNITVSGGDLNGDGLTDLVIGQSTGGVEMRYQSNSGIGISEAIRIKPSFVLSPNPANDKLNLRFYNLSSIHRSSIRIYDVTGKLVYTSMLKSLEAQIDLSGLKNGIYLIQLVSGDNSSSRKFMVAH